MACESEDATLVETGTQDTDGLDPAREGPWRSTGLEIVDGQTGIAWMALDMNQATFDSLELPSGWSSNPRDFEPSYGEFLRSPDSTEEGIFDDADMFGHSWRHVATLSNRGQPVDPEGLLTSTIVDKYHRLTYEPGRLITTLTAPDGEIYVRVTRDPARTEDEATIPAGWTLSTMTPEMTRVIGLVPPTTLYRTDNEDSYQGPIAPSALENP
jgi:hypothetical protein